MAKQSWRVVGEPGEPCRVGHDLRVHGLRALPEVDRAGEHADRAEDRLRDQCASADAGHDERSLQRWNGSDREDQDDRVYR